MEVCSVGAAGPNLINRRVQEADGRLTRRRPLLIDQGCEACPQRGSGACAAVDGEAARVIDGIAGFRVRVQSDIGTLRMGGAEGRAL